jgi:hypothetical protein
MKNAESKRLRALIKAAIRGGLIFAALTAFAMCCYPFSGVSLYLLATIPGDLVYSSLIGPMSTTPFGSFYLYVSYCLIVNSLFGAVLGLFCRITMLVGKEIMSDIKKSHANKTPGI